MEDGRSVVERATNVVWETYAMHVIASALFPSRSSLLRQVRSVNAMAPRILPCAQLGYFVSVDPRRLQCVQRIFINKCICGILPLQCQCLRQVCYAVYLIEL